MEEQEERGRGGMPSPAGPMLELHGSLHHGGSVATPVCHSRGGFKALLRSVLRKVVGVCVLRGWAGDRRTACVFSLHSISLLCRLGHTLHGQPTRHQFFTAGNMHKNAVDGK